MLEPNPYAPEEVLSSPVRPSPLERARPSLLERECKGPLGDCVAETLSGTMDPCEALLWLSDVELVRLPFDSSSDVLSKAAKFLRLLEEDASSGVAESLISIRSDFPSCGLCFCCC